MMNVYTYTFQLAKCEYGTGQGMVIADKKRVARNLIKAESSFVHYANRKDPLLKIKLVKPPQNGCRVFDFTYIE